MAQIKIDFEAHLMDTSLEMFRLFIKEAEQAGWVSSQLMEEHLWGTLKRGNYRIDLSGFFNWNTRVYDLSILSVSAQLFSEWRLFKPDAYGNQKPYRSITYIRESQVKSREDVLMFLEFMELNPTEQRYL